MIFGDPFKAFDSEKLNYKCSLCNQLSIASAKTLRRQLRQFDRKVFCQRCERLGLIQQGRYRQAKKIIKYIRNESCEVMDIARKFNMYYPIAQRWVRIALHVAGNEPFTVPVVPEFLCILAFLPQKERFKIPQRNCSVMSLVGNFYGAIVESPVHPNSDDLIVYLGSLYYSFSTTISKQSDEVVWIPGAETRIQKFTNLPRKEIDKAIQVLKGIKITYVLGRGNVPMDKEAVIEGVKNEVFDINDVQSSTQIEFGPLLVSNYKGDIGIPVKDWERHNSSSLVVNLKCSVKLSPVARLLYFWTRGVSAWCRNTSRSTLKRVLHLSKSQKLDEAFDELYRAKLLEGWTKLRKMRGMYYVWVLPKSEEEKLIKGGHL